MSEVMWRLAWITIIAVATAYATFLFFGSILFAGEKKEIPFVIMSSISPGRHHLQGALIVPTPCDSLSVRVREARKFEYLLEFETWREPNRDCEKRETTRYFESDIFAPALGVSILTTLDGRQLNSKFIERFESKNKSDR